MALRGSIRRRRQLHDSRDNARRQSARCLRRRHGHGIHSARRGYCRRLRDRVTAWPDTGGAENRSRVRNRCQRTTDCCRPAYGYEIGPHSLRIPRRRTDRQRGAIRQHQPRAVCDRPHTRRLRTNGREGSPRRIPHVQVRPIRRSESAIVPGPDSGRSLDRNRQSPGGPRSHRPQRQAAGRLSQPI